MLEVDYKESWALKNWCSWTVVLEKTLESPLDCKKIQPIHPKGDQSWVFIGRTDAEAETPILGPPDSKSWLIGKDPDAGKDWGREEKGTTEDEMVGCPHWFYGHEFEQAPRVGDGQRSLACCGPWGWEELDTTEWVNWTQLTVISYALFVHWFFSSSLYWIICISLCRLTYIMLSHFSHVWPLQPPWTVAHQPFLWDSPGKNTEWVAISSSRESSQPRNWTCVSYVSCSGR